MCVRAVLSNWTRARYVRVPAAEKARMQHTGSAPHARVVPTSTRGRVFPGLGCPRWLKESQRDVSGVLREVEMLQA